MQLGVPIACRRVQLDRDPADDQGCARVRLRQTERLFIEGLPLRIVPEPTAWALKVADHIRRMVANHKKCPLPRYAKQKPQRAKIAIGHDTVLFRYHWHYLRQQGALLGVGI